MPKIRWALDQKKHHVTAWRSSGLTREQYCDLHDIPFKSLRQWPQDAALAERRSKAPEVIPIHLVSGISCPQRNVAEIGQLVYEGCLAIPWQSTRSG